MIDELTEKERAALNALDLSEILGTPEERIRFALDKAMQYLRERNIARLSEKMAWAEHARRVADIKRLQDELGKLTALRDAAVKRLGDMNDLLSRGKGTWPSNTYVHDTLWSAWQAEAFCLRMILAEAGIDSTREAAEAARTEVVE